MNFIWFHFTVISKNCEILGSDMKDVKRARRTLLRKNVKYLGCFYDVVLLRRLL